MAYLNRALTNFRAAVDKAFPDRDLASDGWIGDAAHQATNSDHNPDPDGSVDAWDMDTDLRSGDDAAAIEMLKRVFENHPSSRYWIHNRQIASRSDGWIREPYRGVSPHTEHVHWNTREQYETSTQPFILEEFTVPLSNDDVAKIVSAIHNTTVGGTGIKLAVMVDRTYEASTETLAKVSATAPVVQLPSNLADTIRTIVREELHNLRLGSLDA